MEITFSLNFFREHFHIPEEVSICWGVIVDEDDYLGPETAEKSLGVILRGKGEAINVKTREIVKTYHPLSVRAYPAVMYDGPEMKFETENGWKLNLPRTYIEDLYRNSVYSNR